MNRIATATAEGKCSRRFLVCDSERHIVRLLQVNLERQGETVTPAYDTDTAISLLQNESFDRVVLDAMMGGEDAGYDVLKWIRTNESTKDLWVAVMVQTHEDIAEWELRPHRADLYLAMPFSPMDLNRPQ